MNKEEAESWNGGEGALRRRTNGERVEDEFCRLKHRRRSWWKPDVCKVGGREVVKEKMRVEKMYVEVVGRRRMPKGRGRGGLA